MFFGRKQVLRSLLTALEYLDIKEKYTIFFFGTVIYAPYKAN
jgi:hypothetical protein